LLGATDAAAAETACSWEWTSHSSLSSLAPFAWRQAAHLLQLLGLNVEARAEHGSSEAAWAEFAFEHAELLLAVLTAGSSLACLAALAKTSVAGWSAKARLELEATKEAEQSAIAPPSIPRGKSRDKVIVQPEPPGGKAASRHFRMSKAFSETLFCKEVDRLTSAISLACSIDKAGGAGPSTSPFKSLPLIRLLAPGTVSSSHPSSQDSGLAVNLNIYDVSQEVNIQKLNSVLANRLSPLKFGGVFHAGVEVDGSEWSFGFSEEGSGVTRAPPRQHPSHHYRETVRLPCTQLSKAEIEAVVKDLEERYQGYTYDLLQRNCCHFADDLCQRLGVGAIPSWIHRLARMANRMKRFSQALNGCVHTLHLCRNEL